MIIYYKDRDNNPSIYPTVTMSFCVLFQYAPQSTSHEKAAYAQFFGRSNDARTAVIRWLSLVT
jgi:hypothetical protein